MLLISVSDSVMQRLDLHLCTSKCATLQIKSPFILTWIHRGEQESKHPKRTVKSPQNRNKTRPKCKKLLCLLLSIFSNAPENRDYRRVQVMVAVLEVISSVQNAVSTYGTQMQIQNIFEVILNLTNGKMQTQPPFLFFPPILRLSKISRRAAGDQWIFTL